MALRVEPRGEAVSPIVPKVVQFVERPEITVLALVRQAITLTACGDRIAMMDEDQEGQMSWRSGVELPETCAALLSSRPQL